MMPITVHSLQWGDIAARTVVPEWLGRVWEVGERSLLLVGQDGQVLRLVEPSLGLDPLHLVVPEGSAAHWQALERQLYVWRVRTTIWLGDELNVLLPASDPWDSRLDWSIGPYEPGSEQISRHLALLADWLLARAPESTIGGLLPDLIERAAEGGAPPDRPDLPAHERLFRWRAARVLGNLLPALAQGELDSAELAVNSLAGLGGGDLPAGDHFIMGFAAGIRLWPRYVEAGSGLRPEMLVRRLVRSMIERTNLFGRATLSTMLEGHWGEPWHRMRDALTAAGPYPDELRDQIHHVGEQWLDRNPQGASAALAGLVVPFLWYQRHLT